MTVNPPLLGSLYIMMCKLHPRRMFWGASALCLMVFALLFSAPSFAAPGDPPAAAPGVGAGGPFTVKSTDYFVTYVLGGLLGKDVVDVNAASAAGTVNAKGNLGDVFRMFNIGVAFFGSLIIMFVSVVGILNTGQDGEFLGKRWSSFWVPIRFAGGAAMMLPLTSSGYSFVQAMCIWIAGQGVGFADSVWDAILDAHTPPTGSTIVATVSTSSIVSNIFASEVCMAYINRSIKYDPLSPEVQFNYFVEDSAKRQTTTTHGIWWKPTAGAVIGAAAANVSQVLVGPFNFSPSVRAGYTDMRLGLTRGRDICGAMTYNFRKDSANPLSEAAEKIGGAHMEYVAQARLALQPYAKDFIEVINGGNSVTPIGTPAPGQTQLELMETAIAAEIAKQSELYRKGLIAATDTAILDTPMGNVVRLKQTMKDLGFGVAGAFYMELVKTHNAVGVGLSAVPEFKPADVTQIAATYGESNWALVRDSMNAAIGEAALDVAAMNQDASAAPVAGGAAGGALPKTTVKTIDLNEKMFEGLGQNKYTTFANSISMAVLQSVVGVGGNNQSDPGPLSYGMDKANNGGTWSPASSSANLSPVLQLKNKGDTILNIAGTVYAAHLFASVAAETASSNLIASAAEKLLAGGGWLAGIAKAIEYLSPMILAIVMGLVTMGIMLSVIIPMTPFMLWVMGIAGLLVLIVEALVASVIWAVMIMHPSGEGMMSDHSRQGLMILLMLFMRPALMLMGMEAGIFMVDPMINFVNDMFYFVFKSTQSDNMAGLFIMFGICSVYITLVLAVIRKSFSMIHVIPDRVLNWIGGQGSQLGESEMGDRGEALAGSAGQRVSGMSDAGNRSKGGNDASKKDGGAKQSIVDKYKALAAKRGKPV